MLLALLSVTVLLVLLASVQMRADIGPQPALTDTERAELQQLLLEIAPERPGVASLEDIRLNTPQLNLLSRYVLQLMELESELAMRLTTKAGFLETQLSYQLSDRFMPLYLNIEAHFETSQQQTRIAALKIGHLPIPYFFTEFVTDHIRENYLANSSYASDIQALLESVKQIDLDSEYLRVIVAWDPLLVDRVTQQAQLLFISEKDQQMIQRHYELIRQVVAKIPESRRAISINELMQPLFEAAKNHSLQGSNPIDENRTLFQTLALYVNNENINQLLPDAVAATIPKVKFIEVRLQRRQDLAIHLASMAALTSSTKAEVAEMLSTTKEAYDARYSSGFSFSDITANIAGVALGKLATENVSTAHLLQQRLALLQSEDEYIPQSLSNRDGLSETEFANQYTDRSSTGYLQRIQELEALIYSRPLFMDFPMVDLSL